VQVLQKKSGGWCTRRWWLRLPSAATSATHSSVVSQGMFGWSHCTWRRQRRLSRPARPYVGPLNRPKAASGIRRLCQRSLWQISIANVLRGHFFGQTTREVPPTSKIAASELLLRLQ